MAITWRDGVHACEADGRCIFLDVRSGRYSGAPLEVLRAIRGAEPEGPAPEPPVRALRSLERMGLVVDRPASERVTRPLLHRPSGEFLPVRAVRPSLGGVATALLAQLLARVGLRMLGFRRFYGWFAAPDANVAAADEVLARVARAFELSDIVFTADDRCLSRSVAFRMVSQWRGLGVRLVIGVQGRPFAAHCWVERSGEVVNDRLEAVVPFTPLLAI